MEAWLILAFSLALFAGLLGVIMGIWCLRYLTRMSEVSYQKLGKKESFKSWKFGYHVVSLAFILVGAGFLIILTVGAIWYFR